MYCAVSEWVTDSDTVVHQVEQPRDGVPAVDVIRLLEGLHQ